MKENTDWQQSIKSRLTSDATLDSIMELAESTELREANPNLCLSVCRGLYVVKPRDFRPEYEYWENWLGLWDSRPSIRIKTSGSGEKYYYLGNRKHLMVHSEGYEPTRIPRRVSEFLDKLSQEVHFESWPGCQLYYLGSRPLKKEDSK